MPCNGRQKGVFRSKIAYMGPRPISATQRLTHESSQPLTPHVRGVITSPIPSDAKTVAPPLHKQFDGDSEKRVSMDVPHKGSTTSIGVPVISLVRPEIPGLYFSGPVSPLRLRTIHSLGSIPSARIS